MKKYFGLFTGNRKDETREDAPNDAIFSPSQEVNDADDRRKEVISGMLQDLQRQLAGCESWQADDIPAEVPKDHDIPETPEAPKIPTAAAFDFSTLSATKRVLNLLMVDESGSMSVIREQALSGMNETLEICRKAQRDYPDMEQRVTLVTFDSNHFKVHCKNAHATETAPLQWDDYCPNAATPLYDAIGRGISMMQEQVQEGDKVLVTIITDGMENASKKFTLKKVRKLVNQLEENGWTFALIGTDNLDVKDMGDSMCIKNSMAFHEDAEGTGAMFSRMHSSCSSYYRKIFRDEAVGNFFED